jgi:hypothetical protein
VMSRRETGIAVAVWCVVVVVVATLVWTVVSRAGQGVVTRESRDRDPAASRLETARHSHGAASRRTTGAAPGSPTSTAGTAAPRSGSTKTGSTASGSQTDPSAHPTDGPTGPATASPSGPGTSPTHAPTGSPTHPSHPPTPTHHRRAWHGEEGLVVADCSGETIQLVAAQPDAGYRVEIQGNGPHLLDVHFTATDDPGNVTEVSGLCAQGRPVFHVRKGHPGHDNGGSRPGRDG